MEGIELELVASPAALDGAVDAALLLKASAEPVGMNINVKRVPSDGFWSDIWNKPGNGLDHVLLGRSANQRLDVHDLLRGRFSLERHGLEETLRPRTGSMNWYLPPGLNWIRPSAGTCTGNASGCFMKMAVQSCGASPTICTA